MLTVEANPSRFTVSASVMSLDSERSHDPKIGEGGRAVGGGQGGGEARKLIR